MAGPQPRPLARPLGRLSAALGWALLAVVALAPLPFGANRPWAWSALALAVGVLLTLWAAAALLGRAPAAPRGHWPFALVFAAVAGWIALQAVPWTPASWHHPLWAAAAEALGEPLAGAVSIDPGRTVSALMRLLAYAGVFFLAATLGGGLWRRGLFVVAVAAALYAAYGLAVVFSGADSLLWYRRWAYHGAVTGTFVGRSAFAAYTGLGLIATVALFADEIGRLRGGWRVAVASLLGGRGAWLAVMAAVIATALVASQSRGGLLATAAALAVLALGLARRARGRAIVAGLALAGLIVLVAFAGEPVLGRLNLTLVAAEERPALYRAVVQAIAAEPWRGIGYGTFALAFPMIRGATLPAGAAYAYAHSVYLELALEIGVPAAAALLAVVAGLAWRSARAGSVAGAAGLAAVVLLGLQGLVDFAPQIPAVAATFALLLGLGCATTLRPPEITPRAI